MMEFDESGVAIPGTFAISTVHIGGYGEDGEPKPTVESAVCDVCGEWASNLWTAGRTETRGGDSWSDVRIGRTMQVVVYACPKHSDEISDALVDEYGSAGNTYEADDLAIAVAEAAIARARRGS